MWIRALQSDDVCIDIAEVGLVNLNLNCVDLVTSNRSSLNRQCWEGLINLDLVGVDLVCGQI